MNITPHKPNCYYYLNDNNSKLPGITGGSMPARVFADYMKTAVQNFPKSVFDYPKITTSKGVYLKIDDVNETVDESEEIKADKKAKENLVVPEVNHNQNYIEQGKPTKPQKNKQVFDANSDDLIEYDDEQINTSAPLPGM